MVSTIRALAAVLAVLTAPALAGAQGMFSLTGKVATGSGTFVRLPAVGTPCPSLTGNLATGTVVPQKYPAPITAPGTPLNHGGCIPVPTAATITTTGAGGFKLPTMFFSQGVTGMLRVVPVPATVMVPQLATSFAFTGPAHLNMAFEPQNAVKAGTPKFVAAQWNLFRPNAHLTAAGSVGAGTIMKPVTTTVTGQGTTPAMLTRTTTRNTLNKYVSGRTSADFTACATMVAANVACTFPTQGAIPGVLRNTAGANVFGGTMGLVLTSGPTNVSSVGVTLGGDMTGVTRGAVLLNALIGMGSRLPGRGYAATDTDNLLAGNEYLQHMLTTYTAISSLRVIGMVSLIGAPGGAGTNQNYGFPWSTGTQLIRGTGSAPFTGGPGGGTISVMGYDNRTAMGAGNIQLVSGGIAQSTIQGPNGTPNYSVMRLSFTPEPGAIAGLLAGAGLLGLVAWRSRQS